MSAVKFWPNKNILTNWIAYTFMILRWFWDYFTSLWFRSKVRRARFKKELGYWKWVKHCYQKHRYCSYDVTTECRCIIYRRLLYRYDDCYINIRLWRLPPGGDSIVAFSKRLSGRVCCVHPNPVLKCCGWWERTLYTKYFGPAILRVQTE